MGVVDWHLVLEVEAGLSIETARLWILDALEHYECSLGESANADSLDDDAAKS